MKYAQRGCGCYISGVGKTPAIEFCAKHAAASELLEALRGIVHHYESLLCQAGGPDTLHIIVNGKNKEHPLLLARTAIAKAEGKEQ